MAAVTAAAIGGAALLTTAVMQTADGIKTRKAGEKALNEFDRQELTNVYEDTSIPTAGVEMMNEENARTAANQIQAVQKSGSRAIIGALPRIQAQNNKANQEVRTYLDDRIAERQNNIARDNQRIQQIQEQRDNNTLAGIGQQIEVGRQNTFSGMRGIANSFTSLAGNLAGGFGGGSENMGASNQTRSAFNGVAHRTSTQLNDFQ